MFGLFSANNAQNESVSSWTVLAIFGSFILATVFILFLKKVYYRLFLKKRYYIFPRTSVKGITNIAMVIAISIAAIIMLTILTAGLMAALFRAYPGWRSTIEGVLIKIGGLLFGPIIGIFIGIFTDLLTIAMTAGMFHYGFLIAAIAYGFFSGLAKTVINLSRKKEFRFTVISSILTGIIFVTLFTFINLINIHQFTISLFGFDFSITKNIVLIVFAVIFIITIGIFWGCSLIFDFWKMVHQFKSWLYKIHFLNPIKGFKNKFQSLKNLDEVSNNHINWIINTESKKNKAFDELKQIKSKINNKKISTWFNYFAPVLLAVFCSETIIELLLMPVFDLQFSALPYDYWFALRSIMLVFMLPINIIIVFSVYRIVSPSIKYNYQNDLSESIYVPYMKN